jgi:hypothetical protein
VSLHRNPVPKAELATVDLFAPFMEYLIDAAQLGVLFLDVMRRRGNQYREHLAETVPHVLNYEVELVLDGRTLERPVNYALAKVVPPPGTEIDCNRRPFIVVDPRAPDMARVLGASRAIAKLASP